MFPVVNATVSIIYPLFETWSNNGKPCTQDRANNERRHRRFCKSGPPCSLNSSDLTSNNGVTFAAVGTCGQRFTTTRRLIVHHSVKEALVARLKKAYAGLPVGNPLESGTRVGSRSDGRSFEAMRSARADGATHSASA
ncbi:aldehyde dehydrogenase family protein [Cupriavidus basilensis]